MFCTIRSFTILLRCALRLRAHPTLPLPLVLRPTAVTYTKCGANRTRPAFGLPLPRDGPRRVEELERLGPACAEIMEDPGVERRVPGAAKRFRFLRSEVRSSIWRS